MILAKDVDFRKLERILKLTYFNPINLTDEEVKVLIQKETCPSLQRRG